MKAVILAAGKGTRMKEITKEIPKPMVKIKNKPMLEHIICFLKNAGITDFGIVVGYKRSIVKKYFGDGSFLGVSITYFDQTEQNGTGAALHLARDFAVDGSFFFTYGDIITHSDTYTEMLECYKKTSCDFMLALNVVDDPYRGGAVDIDKDNNITNIIEKPPKGTSKTNLNSAGLMVLTPDIFNYTSKLAFSTRGEYELTEVFNDLIVDGFTLKGYVISGYWRDVGTSDDLEAINSMLK